MKKYKKWLIIGSIIAIAGIIGIIVFMVITGKITEALSVLVGTGAAIFLTRKGLNQINEIKETNDIKKGATDEKIKNNTTNDNYNFGLKFIKRRRNKNNKK